MQVTVAGTAITVEDHRIDGDVSWKMERYLAGERVVFEEAIDFSDMTAFRRRVLAAIRGIPYGDTVTYAELAERVGNPDAVRAVGGACGANPVPVVVPCHRVVETDGVGGYAYGEQVKTALLELERE